MVGTSRSSQDMHQCETDEQHSIKKQKNTNNYQKRHEERRKSGWRPRTNEYEDVGWS